MQECQDVEYLNFTPDSKEVCVRVCERERRKVRQRQRDGQFNSGVSPSFLISLLSSPALNVRAVSLLFMALYLT